MSQIGARNRLRWFECGTAAEDSEPSKEAPFLRCQQVVTPLNCCLERLLTFRSVTRPVGEYRRMSLKSVEQPGLRQNLHSCSREFDCQRKVVQASTDPAHVGSRDEVAPHGGRARCK